MEEPKRAECSICGEESENLKRRLWFRRWEEMLMGQGPPIEVQRVCGRCYRMEWLKTTAFLIIMGIFTIALVVMVIKVT